MGRPKFERGGRVRTASTPAEAVRLHNDGWREIVEAPVRRRHVRTPAAVAPVKVAEFVVADEPVDDSPVEDES